MKNKLLLLTLAAMIGVSSSFAQSVSFSGNALAGTVTPDVTSGAYALNTGTTIEFFDIGALDLNSQNIFADYTAHLLGSTTYDSSFFGNTGAFASPIALSATFLEGDSIGAVLTDGSTKHLFYDASWTAPAAGGTSGVSSVSQANLTQVAVPEPSTYALLAGFAAFIFVAIRRRNA